MAQGDNDMKLARNVRTFAEDMKRAKEGGASAAPLKKPSPFLKPLIKKVDSQVPQQPTKLTRALPPQQESHLTDEGRLLDIKREAKGIGEATLVRDTKRKEWSLGRAIGESLHGWVVEQKQNLEEKARERNPVPKVSPSFNRKEIIERARKESVLAPKDDRTVVIEKLRTFASDTERVTGKKYVIAHDPKPEDIAPHWSSEEEQKQKTETKIPDLRSAIRAIPDTTIKSARPAIRPQGQGVPNTLVAAPQTTKSLASDVAPNVQQVRAESAYVKLQRAQVEAARPKIILPQTPPAPLRAPLTPQTPAIPQTPVVPQTPHIPQVPTRDIAFEKPAFATQETTGFRTYRGDALKDIQERNLSTQNIAAAEATRRAQAPVAEHGHAHREMSARPFVIAGIFMIVVILVGGLGFFFFARERGTLPNNPDVTRIPSLVASDTQRSVTFSSNRDALLETLAASIAGSGGDIVQIYPVVAGSDSAVPTSQFMFVLDPRAPSSFIRNLDETMTFGSYRGLAPFFILKTRQFDTAFAGMLDWEPYMSADLTPLFGPVVERTLDTSLRTISQTSAAFFVDEAVNNIDVRVLRDEQGDERIVYAFADQETIIITTSLAALSELIALIR